MASPFQNLTLDDKFELCKTWFLSQDAKVIRYDASTPDAAPQIYRPEHLNAMALDNKEMHAIFEKTANTYAVHEVHVTAGQLGDAGELLKDRVPFDTVSYLRLVLDFQAVPWVFSRRPQEPEGTTSLHFPALVKLVGEFNHMNDLELTIMVAQPSNYSRDAQFYDANKDTFRRYVLFQLVKSMPSMPRLRSFKATYITMKEGSFSSMGKTAHTREPSHMWRADMKQMQHHCSVYQMVEQAHALGSAYSVVFNDTTIQPAIGRDEPLFRVQVEHKRNPSDRNSEVQVWYKDLSKERWENKPGHQDWWKKESLARRKFSRSRRHAKPESAAGSARPALPLGGLEDCSLTGEQRLVGRVVRCCRWQTSRVNARISHM